MNNTNTFISKFEGCKVVVLGDLVADEYVYGDTSRISREAPVLIVREKDREIRLGGAANVVANIKAMGAEPLPVGLIGADHIGAKLTSVLSDKDISCEGLVEDRARFTTTKTRVLAGGHNTVRQQMLRIDRLNEEPIAADTEQEVINRLHSMVEQASALIVSDYHEGVISKQILAEVLSIAANKTVPVFIDSRFRISAFRYVDALTPNEPELAAASGVNVTDPAEFEKAGRWLLKQTRSKSVLVKRGRNGMALFLPDQETIQIPAFGTVEVADVTGAGDTVLAAFSLARVSGMPAQLAMQVANIAGGIKVTKSGTAVVKADELARVL
jgi:rfaE bifunctional protein kinase chain/domain